MLSTSNYTHAEIIWSQALASWIGAHRRRLPEVEVPDNLKAGAKRACRYEPDLNPTYWAMGTHL